MYFYNIQTYIFTTFKIEQQYLNTITKRTHLFEFENQLECGLIWVWLTSSIFFKKISFYFNERLPHHSLTK